MDAFEQIMGMSDPPLVIVTVAADGERAGCLVGFHCQSGMEPERYSVWLSKANHTYRVAQRSAWLAVHFLSDGDAELAERFGSLTGDCTDKFAGLEVSEGPGRVPLLADCPRRLAVRRTAILDEGGDHVCVTGQVTTASTDGPFRPLRVSVSGHLEPGHAPEERPA
jgi:flavin reductase (DIM6/NTAB) family NADH-FMN oxidoreductase RutF